MRVLVCGGRHFGRVPEGCPSDSYLHYRKKADRECWMLAEMLDTQHMDKAFTLLIHGGAKGADFLADRWARGRGVERKVFAVPKVEWQRWGRAAGPMRNERMLVEGAPDIAIAFPGGAGTADMIKRIRSAGIPLIEAVA